LIFDTGSIRRKNQGPDPAGSTAVISIIGCRPLEHLQRIPNLQTDLI